MTVVTKQVSDRREVHYDSLDDLLTDARELANGEVTCLGNWSLGQICQHLANAFNGSIDGMSFRMPWPMRVLATTLMKKRFLTQTLPPGFKIPWNATASMTPAEDTSTSEGFAALEAVVNRLKNESTRADHPVINNLTRAEWDQFHLRHAELHMSFVRSS